MQVDNMYQQDLLYPLVREDVDQEFYRYIQLHSQPKINISQEHIEKIGHLWSQSEIEAVVQEIYIYLKKYYERNKENPLLWTSYYHDVLIKFPELYGVDEANSINLSRREFKPRHLKKILLLCESLHRKGIDRSADSITHWLSLDPMLGINKFEAYLSHITQEQIFKEKALPGQDEEKKTMFNELELLFYEVLESLDQVTITHREEHKNWILGLVEKMKHVFFNSPDHVHTLSGWLNRLISHLIDNGFFHEAYDLLNNNSYGFQTMPDVFQNLLAIARHPNSDYKMVIAALSKYESYAYGQRDVIKYAKPDIILFLMAVKDLIIRERKTLVSRLGITCIDYYEERLRDEFNIPSNQDVAEFLHKKNPLSNQDRDREQLEFYLEQIGKITINDQNIWSKIIMDHINLKNGNRFYNSPEYIANYDELISWLSEEHQTLLAQYRDFEETIRNKHNVPYTSNLSDFINEKAGFTKVQSTMAFMYLSERKKNEKDPLNPKYLYLKGFIKWLDHLEEKTTKELIRSIQYFIQIQKAASKQEWDPITKKALVLVHMNERKVWFDAEEVEELKKEIEKDLMEKILVEGQNREHLMVLDDKNTKTKAIAEMEKQLTSSIYRDLLNFDSATDDHLKRTYSSDKIKKIGTINHYLYTAEYLYQKYSSILGYMVDIDFTFVVACYIKSIELLLCKKLGVIHTNFPVMKGNSKPICTGDEEYYLNTDFGSYTDYLSLYGKNREKRINYQDKYVTDDFQINKANPFSHHDQDRITKFISDLNKYRRENRNGLFHKSMLKESSHVENIRNKTYKIIKETVINLKDTIPK